MRRIKVNISNNTRGSFDQSICHGISNCCIDHTTTVASGPLKQLCTILSRSPNKNGLLVGEEYKLICCFGSFLSFEAFLISSSTFFLNERTVVSLRCENLLLNFLTAAVFPCSKAYLLMEYRSLLVHLKYGFLFFRLLEISCGIVATSIIPIAFVFVGSTTKSEKERLWYQ